MAITAIRYARGVDLASLESACADLIALGFTTPINGPAQIAGHWVQGLAQGSAPGSIDDAITRIEALEAAMDSHTHVAADITDLVIVSEDADNDISAGSDGGAFYDADA